MLLRGEGKVPFPIPFNNGVAVHHLRGELGMGPKQAMEKPTVPVGPIEHGGDGEGGPGLHGRSRLR